MKILITGINGFVGRILKQELEKKGHDIYGIDINGDGENIFNVNITDLASVEDLINKISPHAVYHLAAISKVDIKNPSTFYSINVNGTLNLLTTSAKLDIKPQFFFISSSQVYGNIAQSEMPISESFRVSPVNHYGASKAAAENIAIAFNKEYKLPLNILRPFNHIGRGQDPYFVVPKIITAFKNRQTEITLGNINVIRDFSDVRDIVNAYVSLLENFNDGETYNISSGNGYKISEIITYIEEICGYNIEILKDDNFIRKSEIFKIIGDNSKICKEINWHPQYDIKETLQWILSES